MEHRSNFNSEVNILYDTVIKGGYCIGCGACATVEGSPFKIKMNEYGNYTAYLDDTTAKSKSNVKLLHICPFSGKSKNEEEINKIVFPHNKIINDKIGPFLNCYAGYVEEENFRENGSSGGFGKWLGYTLMKEDKIDFFVQVSNNKTGQSKEALFKYEIFTNAEDVVNGSKSSYYPTTLFEIINKIRETDGRYAITGVPCFIKTIRLLSIEDKLFGERIRYTIGIVCGGMKSANQAKMIGWQLGVHPDNLISIDFRRKYLDRPANNKIYQVWSALDNIERYKDAKKIIGTDYGAGYFKPNACDYCDDLVSETADISIGDAWLPKYVKDPNGTSILIVRNNDLLEIIDRAIQRGLITLDIVSNEDVIKSQEGGFRHRREALSFRLAKKVDSGQWFPQKRVIPNQYQITKSRKKTYTLREKIAKESQIVFLEALTKNNFDVFITKMKPLDRKYYTSFHGSRIKRFLIIIKQVIFKKLTFTRSRVS